MNDSSNAHCTDSKSSVEYDYGRRESGCEKGAALCSRCASMVVMWKNRYDVDEARWASFQLRSSRIIVPSCAQHTLSNTPKPFDMS